MNFGTAFSIGIKVLAAAAAGFCVYIGFSKSIEKKPNPAQRKKPIGGNDVNVEGEMEDGGDDASLKVVHSLRKFQDTLGKLFSVAQSVSTVSENLYRIFKGGQDPAFGHRPIGNCPQGFTRISSNIIEAGYNPSSHPAYGPSKYWF